MWSQVWTRWKRDYRDYRSGGTAQSKWSSVDLYNRKSINEKGTTTRDIDYPIARGQIVNIMGRCNDMANKEVIQAILLRVSRSWTKLNQFCTNNVSIVIYDEDYEKQDLIFHFLLKVVWNLCVSFRNEEKFYFLNLHSLKIKKIL